MMRKSPTEEQEKSAMRLLNRLTSIVGDKSTLVRIPTATEQYRHTVTSLKFVKDHLMKGHATCNKLFHEFHVICLQLLQIHSQAMSILELDEDLNKAIRNLGINPDEIELCHPQSGSAGSPSSLSRGDQTAILQPQPLNRPSSMNNQPFHLRPAGFASTMQQPPVSNMAQSQQPHPAGTERGFNGLQNRASFVRAPPQVTAQSMGLYRNEQEWNMERLADIFK
jgi:hypothetical protein